MPAPLHKSEYTKIFEGYVTRAAKTVTENSDTTQELPTAAPQPNGTANPQAQQPQTSSQPDEASNMKEFTDTLAKLGEHIGKFKDPKAVEAAAAAIQEMLKKKPQSNTPVGTGNYMPPNGGSQSPMQKSNANIPAA